MKSCKQGSANKPWPIWSNISLGSFFYLATANFLRILETDACTKQIVEDRNDNAQGNETEILSSNLHCVAAPS